MIGVSRLATDGPQPASDELNTANRGPYNAYHARPDEPVVCRECWVSTIRLRIGLAHTLAEVASRLEVVGREQAPTEEVEPLSRSMAAVVRVRRRNPDFQIRTLSWSIWQKSIPVIAGGDQV